MQGWVTALDVREDDATLAVMLGSHDLHNRMRTARNGSSICGAGNKDWVRYGPAAFDFLAQNGCAPLRIACPAGSLVLWDSRTAHYGAPPLRGRADPTFRAVVYVCYTPRGFASQTELLRKRAHFF